jgi:hypothetical protein
VLDRIVLRNDGIHYYLGAQEVTEAEYRQVHPEAPLGGMNLDCPALKRGWPLLSEGAAVHPTQVQEAQDSAARKGVPTEFTKDGRAVFRNRQHRKEYLRAYGFHDRDGGYGDG